MAAGFYRFTVADLSRLDFSLNLAALLLMRKPHPPGGWGRGGTKSFANQFKSLSSSRP